jgi:hypothetical protein
MMTVQLRRWWPRALSALCGAGAVRKYRAMRASLGSLRWNGGTLDVDLLGAERFKR